MIARLRLLVLALAIVVIASVGTASAGYAAPAADPAFKALVFSKTAGFRHTSIPAGIAAIQKLGQENNFAVDATEDGAAFTEANLAQYKVVIFLSTTGDVLNDAQQTAFQHYIEGGGGFAGVHAAADTEYDWPWYGELVGAYFKQHPAPQQAVVKVEDPAHPSTQGLPAKWTRSDEWYDYQANPRENVHVLTSLDETTYSGGTMGFDHPNTWCQDYKGGRSWYTGLGHDDASFTETNFLHLLLGGIQTAAGVVPADCSASLDAGFEKVTLDDNTSNPMMLDVAADGRVYYIDRLGDVKVIKPGAGGVATAAHLDVFTANESGLLGLALDPAFVTNHWIYFYYSPNGKDVDRLSRFTVNTDSTLDLSTEKVLLEVPVQRSECCHHGGGMVFDPATGDLWLGNGDNSNPFASDGYTPIDERAGRSTWDSQRSSANTNDLRGKILRIHPEADGTYTVPAGNLFAPGTEKTRPEIYGMGFRNPFRIGIDPATHKLMVADYGPDAGAANPARGPENTVEWQILNQPGFYGWPYCVGDNKAYVDYDFATGASGAPFDCAAPKNNSPNNTGLVDLPPAIPAMVYGHYAGEPKFPELGAEGAPMAGPVYRYDENLTSDRKWPAYWDGKAIFGEWNTDKLFSFQLNEDGSQLVDINRILNKLSFKKPMDMKYGADGALYLIEWGSGFGGDNADSGVYRIDYVRGNRSPIATATADKSSGAAPLTVGFSSEGSRDPDGNPITFAWDFESDGTVDSAEPNPQHTYGTNGNFSATLTVTSANGKSASASVPVVVGNTMPVVTLNLPPNGGFFDFGDQVKYTVTVTDPEDGTVDCASEKMQAILGHDTHGHPLDQYTGCSGTVQTTLSSGHSDGDNVFYVLEASYTDKGGAGGSQPLTGRAQAILQPKHKQAEYFSSTGRVADGTGTGNPGVQVETAGDSAGGFKDIGSIEDGDYWSFDPANLSDIDVLRFRTASASGGGTIEVHAGTPDGLLLGKVGAPPTGAWQTYTDVTVALATPRTVTEPLFFVARKPSGSSDNGGLFNVNWVDFVGKGVTDNQRPTVALTATPTTGEAPLAVNFHSVATDPEGDNPLTYQWNFGVPGAPQPSTPDASYTYRTAGSYDASVTVTDSRGAARTEHVPITVDSPGQSCLGGRSDSFAGTQLDRTKWTVVRENQDLRVSGGALHIPTALADIYGGNNSTPVPNLVVQPAPDGSWEATTKVTLAARDAYQQAGLVLYGDDDNYAKMVLEAQGANDINRRVFQFIREEQGVPNEKSQSNVPASGSAYSDTVYLRMASDGTHVTGAYSADGTTWTAMPETDKLLAGITNPRIGLISLASGGTRPVIDAAFDSFQLTPDETAGPDDEFDGTSLDSCRWSTVVRPDAATQRIAGGNLEIDTSKGEIYGGDNSAPKNFTLQTPPAGDWTVETKVDGSAFTEAYQQAGLIAYGDDGNYVKIDYLTNNTAGSPVTRGIELRSEIGDVVQNPQSNIGDLTQGVWFLRLAKLGDTYRGFYSADGVSWTELGSLTNAAVANAKVGLFAFGVNQVASKTAKFDYFHLSTAPIDETAPVTTAVTDPAAPNAAGWYGGPVEVALSAADEPGGSGLAGVEYKLDGGEWAAYTAPVSVTGDGGHTVAYRSADLAGNVEAGRTVTVNIDATKPTATVSGLTAGQIYGDSQDLRIAWQAVDATSGVGPVTATLDGRPYQSGTLQALYELEAGLHELSVTVTDNAGNQATHKVSFGVDTSTRDLANLIDRFKATGRLSAAGANTLHTQLTKARKAEANGNDGKTITELGKFKTLATDPAIVVVGEVRQILGRDTDVIVARLSGPEPSSRRPT
ncbi:MAG: cytochrome c [Actinomycetota bacterium]|nr:cytochrome c [Actinomycetota bacterium]